MKRVGRVCSVSLDGLLETPIDRRTFLKLAFTGVLSVLVSEEPFGR